MIARLAVPQWEQAVLREPGVITKDHVAHKHMERLVAQQQRWFRFSSYR